ncbi:unnamed protein product [Closterium sp. Naga37s-1]|nr:unnamed protein product [Closterium sp. Naga37s-1]
MTSLKDLSLSPPCRTCPPCPPPSLPSAVLSPASWSAACTSRRCQRRSDGWERLKLKLSQLRDLKSLPRSLYQLPWLNSLEVSSCLALESLFGDEHTGDAYTGGAHTGGEHTGDAHTGDAHTRDAHTGDAHTEAAGQELGGRITRLEVAGHTGSSNGAGSCGGSEESGTGVMLPSLELPALEDLSLLGCERLAQLPAGLQQMGKLQTRVVSRCPLLSTRRRVVIYGTSNLDEGERAVGGSEEDDSDEDEEEEEEWSKGEESEGEEGSEQEDEEGSDL